MSVYVGIDPGKSGAICFLEVCGNEKVVHFIDWPKNDENIYQFYKDICRYYENDLVGDVSLVILERVHSMPGQGVKSMFSFGTNYGIWQGFLIALEWPYIIVPPQTWMKGIVGSADGKDTKTRVANAAQRLFPEADLKGPKGGYKDGRGDALLMAYYAMQQDK